MNAVEKLLGTPMAAPESRAMRRLRMTVITLASTLAVGILLTNTLRVLLGPVVAGGLLAIMLVVSFAVGVFYFTRKSRLDNAWLDQLVAKDRTA